MRDELAELYEKILDGQFWEIDDLDRLAELSKHEGFVAGELSMKHKAIEAFKNWRNQYHIGDMVALEDFVKELDNV